MYSLGPVAQWIEQFRPKEEVVRSTRTRVTNTLLASRGRFLVGSRTFGATRTRVTKMEYKLIKKTRLVQSSTARIFYIFYYIRDLILMQSLFYSFESLVGVKFCLPEITQTLFYSLTEKSAFCNALDQ